MWRLTKVIIKSIAAIFLLMILAMAGLFVAIETDSIQQSLLKKATAIISQRLGTMVNIGHISLDLMGLHVVMSDIAIADLQQRHLLQIDELGVHLDAWQLIDRQLVVTEAHVEGMAAKLHQARGDTVANYQFLIDALRDTTKTAHRDSTAIARKKRKMQLDVRRLRLERITIDYEKEGKEQHVRIGMGDMHRRDERYLIDIDTLYIVTDNHRPRKNHGKPKRGFFDAGHLNIMARVNMEVTPQGNDSIEAVINDLAATDIGSGLTVKSLTARVVTNKELANVEALTISLPQTTLNIPRAVVRLPSKKAGRRLAWSAPRVKGRVVLQDIAHAFAPVLRNFTEPLMLQTAFSGTDDGLRFTGVNVSTPDKKLHIKAAGAINHLKKGRELKIHFDVQQMRAKTGVKERIISQFPVKKLMMTQLHALGDIGYQGHFDVVWRRETFAGLLTTAGGPLRFNFTIDGNSKYVTGAVKTDSFELGQVMNLKQIGKIACEAQFKIDISKPRTARMRREKGGKLPIGEVEAHVFEAKHKLGRVKNLYATIASDGAVAEGSLCIHGKHMDVVCSFSFTNTDDMHKMKVKPGLKFHKLTEEDRAAKEQRKAEKAAAKEQRKAEKAAAKEQRKAEKAAAKEQRKAEKAAAKEQRKAEKAAAKEQRKAEKAAAKEQRKAEKAAAK